MNTTAQNTSPKFFKLPFDHKSFYVVDRNRRKTYTIHQVGSTLLFASSNIATDGEIILNAKRLIKGIAERRYRLTPRII